MNEKSKDMDLGIMGDIYRNCNACYALIDIQPRAIRDYTTLTSFCNNYHEQCLLGNNHILPYLQQCFASSLQNLVRQQAHTPNLPLRASTVWQPFFASPGFTVESDDVEGLCDILGATWWGRVWTLQETVLPPAVHLVAETDPTCNTLPLDAVKALLTSMEQFMSIVDDQMDGIKTLLPADYNWDVFRRMQQSIRNLTGTLCLRTTYHQAATDFQDVLDHLSQSPRQCLDPCDYIYGVLGLLNMDIPRRKSTTDKMANINLARATCLEDVYGQLKSQS
ncbi:hypothetical protein BX666DRAFT_1877284 [Dichotomocladium elegans]|nr:hypothetical protein BX666DRAFT_1877284 [Dichotomocladium elegans]